MAVAAKVPSPADQPIVSARQLLARIRKEGGHVYRMREHAVFVITHNAELAQWLFSLGGSPYLPRNMTPTHELPQGAYRDSKDGKPKWDIYIHAIPLRGEQTVWEKAGESDDTIYEVE